MIYFLRHQKTVNNQFEIISGQTDSPILKENVCIEKINEIEKIDVVYSSPSKRCLDTLGRIPELLVYPVIDKRLLERNMGDFENCSRKKLYEQYPDFFWNINGNIRFRFELTPPNGEEFSVFRERIVSFCNEVILSNEECNILICSHNQTMKMMYLVLKGIEPSEENWRKVDFPNGEIVTYTFHS